ncbi:MAG: hypothetical protein AAF127_09820 [Pseudomonadota bacterium]
MSGFAPANMLARLLYDEESQYPAHFIAFIPMLVAALILAWAAGWLPASDRDFDRDDQRAFVSALNERRPALNIDSGLYPELQTAQEATAESGQDKAEAAGRSALRQEFVQVRRRLASAMDSASVQLTKSWNGPLAASPFALTQSNPMSPSMELIADEAVCPLRGWSADTRPIVRQLVILGFTGRCSDMQIFAARSPALYSFGFFGWLFIIAPVFAIAAAAWFWQRVFRVRAAYRWLYRSKVMFEAKS